MYWWEKLYLLSDINECLILFSSYIRVWPCPVFSLIPGVDSSRLKGGPCYCGGVVRGEPGVRGGCGCAASELGGSQDWTCVLDPTVTSSSFGLGCCWLASGPCWTAPPRSPATQPGNTNTPSEQKETGARLLTETRSQGNEKELSQGNERELSTGINREMHWH